MITPLELNLDSLGLALNYPMAPFMKIWIKINKKTPSVIRILANPTFF